MTLTITSLKEVLTRPFPVEVVQLEPTKVKRQENDWYALAVPFVSQQSYEERLDTLAWGHWSTPSTQAVIVDRMLLFSLTLMLCGVAHTAYAVVPCKEVNEQHDPEYAIAQAYAQAFRRACAKFGLGKYLSDLTPKWLPYSPKTKAFALNRTERIHWIEKMYQEAKLEVVRLTGSATLPSSDSPSTPPPAPAPRPLNRGTSPVAGEERKPDPPTSSSSTPAPYPTTYPHHQFFDWVCQCVDRDPQRIADMCHRFQVASLDALNAQQRIQLTRRLEQQTGRKAPLAR